MVAPKIEALEICTKKRNDEFLDNCSNNIDQLTEIFVDHLSE
jgi:hypothetical protein